MCAAFLALLLLAAAARADEASTTQLTVYNRGFATVRETRTFELVKGANDVRVTGVTSSLEPESVVLRDVKNAGALRILEQDYEANPLSAQHMLEVSEGRVLDFEVVDPSTSARRVVKAKLVRAPSGPSYDRDEGRVSRSDAIVEMDGRLRFELPGLPLFEALDPQAFLKPTLRWKLDAAGAGRHEAEVSYITGGIEWNASYSFVADKGDTYDVLGFITLRNESGKDFDEARVKLVAGDVARARRSRQYAYDEYEAQGDAMMSRRGAPVVEERAFDEYHLYELPRPTTVRDRETKQVEFLRAVHVPATRLFVYDGTARDAFSDRYGRSAGDSNTKVLTVLELSNTAANGLGLPLPRGPAKAYRRDADGREEFIGEDVLDHTPRGETFRVALGNAFDLVGERRSMDNQVVGAGVLRSSIEIVLRNHRAEAAEIRVVEHVPATSGWKIVEKSAEFVKIDAGTIEFRLKVPAGGEAKVTYTVETRS